MNGAAENRKETKRKGKERDMNAKGKGQEMGTVQDMKEKRKGNQTKGNIQERKLAGNEIERTFKKENERN